MRGAVLHKMGLHLVKERLMRRHYGVEFWRRGFQNGIDPEYLRGCDATGEEVCKDVMNWYATKVFNALRNLLIVGRENAERTCCEVSVR